MPFLPAADEGKHATTGVTMLSKVLVGLAALLFVVWGRFGAAHRPTVSIAQFLPATRPMSS